MARKKESNETYYDGFVTGIVFMLLGLGLLWGFAALFDSYITSRVTNDVRNRLDNHSYYYREVLDVYARDEVKQLIVENCVLKKDD